VPVDCLPIGTNQHEMALSPLVTVCHLRAHEEKQNIIHPFFLPPLLTLQNPQVTSGDRPKAHDAPQPMANPLKESR
jgi:hypothetical protein